MITQTEALRRFCAEAETAPYVAVDTEFMRENTYYPILCLMQVAIGGRGDKGDERDGAAVIDTMADGIDLEPFYALMRNDRVLKVFHAARQDLEIFFHRMGSLPHPVFDTQVAAMVCGFGDSIGFENLISRLTGKRVDKGARFTDWSVRPLSKRQVEYALADVVYLRPAYEKLRRRLEKSGREPWIEEEMSALLDERIYDIDPDETFRRIKIRNPKPRTLAVLRELAAWREREAQARDLPRNRVARDEALVEIAHQTPRDVEQLARTRGLSRKLAEGSMGKGILQAVKRGLAVPDDQCPARERRPDLPHGLGPTSDLLRVLLKARCEHHDVAQKLVASADDLELIAGLGDAADVPALRSWRREVFGEDALRLRDGRAALAVRDGAVTIVPLDDGPAGP